MDDCRPPLRARRAIDIVTDAIAARRAAIHALVDAVPFSPNTPIRIVDIGAGDGTLAGQLLTAYPRATITAFEASEPQRAAATTALASFGERARVRPFDIAALDWWDVMFGTDLLVSAFALHRLNDAKKQYLYKAAANRAAGNAALIVADRIMPMRAPAAQTADDHPSALFHHLVWLRHAGFAAVDCVWLSGDLAVFGGFK
jgi:cyclopropane fatty-acyl-phospholipid synthase-like methyltransferase